MNGSSSSTVASPTLKVVLPFVPIDLVRIEPPERDVVAREERLEHVGARGHDCGASCRQRSDRLRVRLRHAFDGAEKLEMLRPDVRNDDDVGPRDLAERGDLAEAAHPHLGHEHARLRLEPADGERQADLVVQASVGPDRGHVRRRRARRGCPSSSSCPPSRPRRRPVRRSSSARARRARPARPPGRPERASRRRALARRRRSRPRR